MHGGVSEMCINVCVFVSQTFRTSELSVLSSLCCCSSMPRSLRYSALMSLCSMTRHMRKTVCTPSATLFAVKKGRAWLSRSPALTTPMASQIIHLSPMDGDVDDEKVDWVLESRPEVAPLVVGFLVGQTSVQEEREVPPSSPGERYIKR
jgi:hypothetical protein